MTSPTHPPSPYNYGTVAPAQAGPRRSALERSTAMWLAANEYQRYVEHLRELSTEDWARPTDCPDWDVRAMATHVLGMAEMAASIREGARQRRLARAAGGVFIDALTALQVAEHAGLRAEEIVDRLAAVAPKAARGRKYTPWLVRRRRMPVDQQLNGIEEAWTIGYLIDTILTRDPWMHRVDSTRATGKPMTLTQEHDGLIVADVVAEWVARHGQPCTLVLGGLAGGRWSFGAGGPTIELDAIEFCRTVSRRAEGAGLLEVEVPF
jgi:uncharacterized protein (TIGR03083 family)